MIFQAASLSFAMLLMSASAAMSTANSPNEDEVCVQIKQRVSSSLNSLPAEGVSQWSCDFTRSESHADYHVVGLHGAPCVPNGCASNLMGWYAFRKSDGQILEWNMADDVPGKPL